MSSGDKFYKKNATLAFLRLNVRLRLRASAECFVLSFACSIASVCLCCLLAAILLFSRQEGLDAYIAACDVQPTEKANT